MRPAACDPVVETDSGVTEGVRAPGLPLGRVCTWSTCTSVTKTHGGKSPAPSLFHIPSLGRFGWLFFDYLSANIATDKRTTLPTLETSVKSESISVKSDESWSRFL